MIVLIKTWSKICVFISLYATFENCLCSASFSLLSYFQKRLINFIYTQKKPSRSIRHNDRSDNFINILRKTCERAQFGCSPEKLQAVDQKICEEGIPSQLFLSNSTKILSRIIGLSNIVRTIFGRTLFGCCFYTNISL